MKKAKYAALALSLLLVTGVLAGCGEKSTGEGGQTVLKIGTDPTYPPFEYTNDKNELIGFDRSGQRHWRKAGDGSGICAYCL